MRSEQLLNGNAQLIPRLGDRQLSTIAALRAMYQDVASPSIGPRASALVKAAVPGSIELARTAAVLAVQQRRLVRLLGSQGWSHLTGNARRFQSIKLQYQPEQSPDRTNRVTLGATRDTFRSPRAMVEWHWNELDVAQHRTDSCDPV